MPPHCVCLLISLSRQKLESELKLLEKQADDTVSRQLKLLQTAARTADSGVAKYRGFASDGSRFVPTSNYG